MELSNGENPVKAYVGPESLEIKKYPELQAQAAEDFQHLNTAKAAGEKTSRLAREYYYMYTAPTAKEREENAFDSAFLEAENEELIERPAYCVLAYKFHVCPPVSEGTHFHLERGGCGGLPSSITVSGFIEPMGAKAFSYKFEYGPTDTYGESTEVKTLSHEDSRGRIGVHVEVPTTAFAKEGACATNFHFRVVATNARSRRAGADPDGDYRLLEWFLRLPRSEDCTHASATFVEFSSLITYEND